MAPNCFKHLRSGTLQLQASTPPIYQMASSNLTLQQSSLKSRAMLPLCANVVSFCDRDLHPFYKPCLLIREKQCSPSVQSVIVRILLQVVPLQLLEGVHMVVSRNAERIIEAPQSRADLSVSLKARRETERRKLQVHSPTRSGNFGQISFVMTSRIFWFFPCIASVVALETLREGYLLL